MASRNERLTDEIALICAIYPERMHWNPSASELSYKYELGGFELRIPDGYLDNELPVVLSARRDRDDVRDALHKRILETCSAGEEVIDSIIIAFDEMLSNAASVPAANDIREDSPQDQCKSRTVIVWLHHLLNTNKRKHALAPTVSGISGVTKPGYPGVLIYSGPAEAVTDHVDSLKSLNWQAFQVRAENEEEWMFNHGAGVIEVEAMKDVVADLQESNRELFLTAMRMR